MIYRSVVFGSKGLFVKSLIIRIIRLYQNSLSVFFIGSCKFYPSCSQYAIDSLNKHGLCRGLYYAVKRILRCNVFSKGGYDPVK